MIGLDFKEKQFKIDFITYLILNPQLDFLSIYSNEIVKYILLRYFLILSPQKGIWKIRKLF